eukprot:GABV01000384.1.p1 GENE.GABV01000384.1~~GABV01000384.1.p1  ORF type:complete len:209 (+),score=30.17 GABV01000384.1:38-628(+)
MPLSYANCSKPSARISSVIFLSPSNANLLNFLVRVLRLSAHLRVNRRAMLQLGCTEVLMPVLVKTLEYATETRITTLTQNLIELIQLVLHEPLLVAKTTGLGRQPSTVTRTPSTVTEKPQRAFSTTTAVAKHKNQLLAVLRSFESSQVQNNASLVQNMIELVPALTYGETALITPIFEFFEPFLSWDLIDEQKNSQ